MTNILLVILTILGTGVAAYLGANRAISKSIFTIKLNERQNEINLEPVNPTGKVEFLSDATEKELEEMNQEPKLKRFLKGFIKPAKE